MGEVIFRPVEFDDLKAVCAFPENKIELFSSFPDALYPLSVEQLIRVIKKRMASSVLDIAGQAVGFSNLYDYQDGDYCFIGNVFISPAWRKHGLGETLVRSMMIMAFDKYGFQNVKASCFEFNEKAMRLYERIGFVAYDSEVRRHPDGDDIELIHLQYDIFRYVREVKKGVFIK